MPSYLDAGPQDVYALNRLGSTFSDMVIGLQLNRQRQQQFLAQQAMEAARLQIERERQQSNELTAREERKKLGAETSEIGARGTYLGAQAEDLKSQTLAGQRLGQALSQYYPGPSIGGEVARNAGIIAQANPANIGRNVAQIEILNDPVLRNLLATGTRQYMDVPAGGNVVNLGLQQPTSVYSAPPRPAAARDPQQLQDESLRALGSVYGDLGKAHALRTPQGTNTLNALNAALAKYPGGAPQSAPQVPKPGDIYKGYRFKGGDPSDKESWEPTQSQ